jgi:hypothetical protein
MATTTTEQPNLASIGVDVSLETMSLVGLCVAILIPLAVFVILLKKLK